MYSFLFVSSSLFFWEGKLLTLRTYKLKQTRPEQELKSTSAENEDFEVYI